MPLIDSPAAQDLLQMMQVVSLFGAPCIFLCRFAMKQSQPIKPGTFRSATTLRIQIACSRCKLVGSSLRTLAGSTGHGREAQTLGDSHSQMPTAMQSRFRRSLSIQKENATTHLRKLVASGKKPARAGFVSFTKGPTDAAAGFVSSLGMYVF